MGHRTDLELQREERARSQHQIESTGGRRRVHARSSFKLQWRPLGSDETQEAGGEIFTSFNHVDGATLFPYNLLDPYNSLHAAIRIETPPPSYPLDWALSPSRPH